MMIMRRLRRSTRNRKVLEMRDEGSLDRISILPDELLCYILSFLSTCNAVKTSILSTRWRYLFTFTSILSFSDIEYFGRCGSPMASQNEALKMSFERFVNRVLALHRISPIQKFSLVLGETCKYDCSDLRVWISAAVQKEVRHLRLFISSFPNALPNCIFNSQTLVSLYIKSTECKLRVPGTVCLPSLETLKLYNMTFLDSDSVNRFFIGCLQLKELALYNCQLTTDHVRVSAKALRDLTISLCKCNVEIDAPNLTNISYTCLSSSAGIDSALSLKTICSLLRLKLGIFACGAYYPPHIFLDFITSGCDGRELIRMCNAVKCFTRSELKSLRFGECRHDTWKYLTYWLANSAQLETIIFDVGLIKYDTYDREYEWDPFMELPPFSSNIKFIEVHCFEGDKLELLLLKYLLENAGLLIQLVLYKDSSMTIEEELRVSKELLMLPKASTYCTIELKNLEN